MTRRSRSRADSADLKQVDLGAAIHLALHQLEPGDLTFGLSVGPGRDNRRAHGGTVTNDAVGEGSDEARLGLLDPGIQVASGLPADDDMAAGDEVTGGDQGGQRRLETPATDMRSEEHTSELQSLMRTAHAA